MTDPNLTSDTTTNSATEAEEAQVRELAAIPAVEVINRAAVMLMSAASEKIGLADSDPVDSPIRDVD